MHYEIMSRIEASKATQKEDAPRTAIISITDCGSAKNTFRTQGWLRGVLDLQFDDVLTGGHNCITPAQAAEIADFVLQELCRIERFIVHCEFGQSRSAGIAAAIRQYLEGSDGGVFSDRRYYPNRTCYHRVLKALRKRGRMPGNILRRLRFKLARSRLRR